MAVVAPEPVLTLHARDSVRKQLRGSSLLLGGRLLSMGINFVAQVLIVRHLTTSDYGAFAYALAAVAFWGGFSSLGLRRGITRFIPIYHERQDYGRILGTLVLSLGTAVVVSTIAIVSLHAFPGILSHFVKDRGAPIDLLLILIFLVPVDALDELLVALFACFSHPKAIFYRKHVMGPGLKLGVVVLLLLVPHADVRFLAWGYFAANVLSVAVLALVFVRLMQREGLLQNMQQTTMNIPAKEIFAFTIPLLTTNLVAVIMHTADTMILGYFHPTAEVARYRAILPAADMNAIVLGVFGILYTPLSARLFARGDMAGIRALYWKTAVWMAVFSFPIFALTFCMAPSVTVGLYGQRYASAAILLQMLSAGYYFDVVVGSNGLTLKVLGKLKFVVVLNAIAMLSDIILDILFIPHYGAVGAAGTTMVSMFIYNVLKQIGLCRATGMRFIEWHYLPVYIGIVAATVLLLVVQALLPGHNLVVDLTLVAAVSLLVIRMSKSRLEVEETFPELLRLPFVGWLLRSRQPEALPGRP
jgi:O-antigen/teichoic acid export membrane protein